MSSGAFLVAFDRAGWSVASVTGEQVQLRQVEAACQPDQPPPADRIAAALAELAYDGGGVCLALPAEMVMTAEIDCGNLPRKDRYNAMMYRLEEQMPLEVERLTADFLPAVAGRSLGMAVDTERVRAIVDALADVGIETAVICPAAMLALWHLTHEKTISDEYTIFADMGHVDVFRMRQGQPAAWHTVAADTAELVRCIRADMLIRPAGNGCATAALVGALGEEMSAALKRDTGLAVQLQDDASTLGAASYAAKAVLAGHKAGWVDFRRGGLALTNVWAPLSGLLRLAVMLGIGLMILLAGMLFYRGSRYDAVAGQYERKQTAEFGRLYPNRSIPVNVKSSLQSDLRRLSAVRGIDGAVPEQVCALDTLRRIVASMPADLRLRILEMRIEPTGILIEGQARNHTDAGTFAQSLTLTGLIVEPPRTENLARKQDEVAFTLVGNPAANRRRPVAAAGGAK
ncbi:MAG: hypothetical protein HQ546_01180 [Planctomycetes bacterium]|nr:hypothetical protein [Planctomycetota bacterium]